VTFASSVGAFLRAPGRRKLLAFEAGAELLRARVMTLLPARIYTRDFGRMGAVSDAPDGVPDGTRDSRDTGGLNSEMAAEIGGMVDSVARAMPFRAVCLQQALASSRMLRRRGVPVIVYLGVNRNPAERAAPELEAAAHAWVKVGSKVISSDGNLADYAVVARFD
jgi:hypothetical protein